MNRDEFEARLLLLGFQRSEAFSRMWYRNHDDVRVYQLLTGDPQQQQQSRLSIHKGRPPANRAHVARDYDHAIELLVKESDHVA